MCEHHLSAEQLATSLNAKRHGRRWMALCPAHEEKTPSFSIQEGAQGRVLVHCFGGCSSVSVISALRRQGLWPDASPAAKQVAARKTRQQRVFRAKIVLALAESDLSQGKSFSPDDVSVVRQACSTLGVRQIV